LTSAIHGVSERAAVAVNGRIAPTAEEFHVIGSPDPLTSLRFGDL